eukprot:TRINITY_DN5509_c0_g1_i8.p1 TRINITY_DN5509_c0_g1~~TRINITY_DN5509_c0_g1_i8.p1  ORF type:complete len:151 (-),score=29.72 TRINITY_DN5509_c0_g1_i8:82-534(-)
MNKTRCPNCKNCNPLSSKFCNNCGTKLPESLEVVNIQLKNEVSMLRSQLEELKSIIRSKEMREFSTNEMYVIGKQVNGGEPYFCPPPSFIVGSFFSQKNFSFLNKKLNFYFSKTKKHLSEASPSFLKLLGYVNLDNFFFPRSHPQVPFPT